MVMPKAAMLVPNEAPLAQFPFLNIFISNIQLRCGAGGIA